MANNENFLDNIEVAYYEYKKFSFLNDEFFVRVLAIFFAFSLAGIIALSFMKGFVFLISIIALPFGYMLIDKFTNRKRFILQNINYLGKISDLFDINHPVIENNKDKILKHLESNKSLSGIFAFELYCKIKKHDDIEQAKLTINNVTYDRLYVNGIFEENKEELMETK